MIGNQTWTVLDCKKSLGTSQLITLPALYVILGKCMFQFQQYISAFVEDSVTFIAGRIYWGCIWGLFLHTLNKVSHRLPWYVAFDLEIHASWWQQAHLPQFIKKEYVILLFCQGQLVSQWFPYYREITEYTEGHRDNELWVVPSSISE